MTSTRREFLQNSAFALTVGGALPGAKPETNASGVASAAPYRPVVTPNGLTAPHRVVNGVKVFHLIAEEVRHTFAPGLEALCWGYNGKVHGPTLEAVEGDKVRIYVTNRLETATTVHWHGLYVPSGMDGVGGLSQRSIEPGETFLYEFTLRHHGTYMYHSHHDEMTQMAMGLMGMIVVHPKSPSGPPVDRDFVYMLSEWRIIPGTRRPDPNEMTDFNVLTLNGKIFPATDPLVVKRGDRVRIRFGNLSAMDHHPIHLHGHSFTITATDGGDIPESARWPETTVLVPTGSTRTIEFIATEPGDWAMHCHMTHHVMTQMGHGIPNIIGLDPSLIDEKLTNAIPEYAAMAQGAMNESSQDLASETPPNSLPMVGGNGPYGTITMSGMFTIMKVRDAEPTGDGGWYAPPEGTLARPATEAELSRDGIPK